MKHGKQSTGTGVRIEDFEPLTFRMAQFLNGKIGPLMNPKPFDHGIVPTTNSDGISWHLVILWHRNDGLNQARRNATSVTG